MNLQQVIKETGLTPQQFLRHAIHHAKTKEQGEKMFVAAQAFYTAYARTGIEICRQELDKICSS